MTAVKRKIPGAPLRFPFSKEKDLSETFKFHNNIGIFIRIG